MEDSEIPQYRQECAVQNLVVEKQLEIDWHRRAQEDKNFEGRSKFLFLGVRIINES